MKKAVLRNFAKFTGKHLCQSLFFNKVASFTLATLLKKRLWHRCFPVNFAKFLRTPFLQNTSGRLFLYDENVVAVLHYNEIEPQIAGNVPFCCSSTFKKFLSLPNHSIRVWLKEKELIVELDMD